MYRVYCEGREFGLSYSTLEKARAVKAAFAKSSPSLKYYIRKEKP